MKHSRRLSLSRATFSAFLLSSLSLNFAHGAPAGGHIVSGSGSIQQSGNLTTIHASNGAVINFNSFNIGKGETVNFIQPSSHSRVLDRVTGGDPTRIFGMLEANGIVYLINPSGIYFQNGSMLNVGHIYAAAGNLANEDFMTGKNHFTGVAGDVTNAGKIVAKDGAQMIGEHVANFGSITAKNGVVVLASGSDILLGQRDSNIFVKANAAPAAAPGSAPGVQNTGQIRAPRAIMGAGDMYSVAISNTGIIKSKNISVNGGNAGAVNVSGTLNASSHAANAKGGTIKVTGAAVALQGATLDASGTKGGGTIMVGGGFHGKGKVPAAATTTVDAATVIKADALSSGTGGKVVVWSNQATADAGAISARGAGTGSGGSAEVSSKGTLTYTGSADLTAANGVHGNLLLDPANIVVAASGANTTVAPGGAVAFGDTPLNATISAANLVSALDGANVTLEANVDITFQASVTANSGAAHEGSLTLEAGHSILFGSNVVLTLNGSLTAIAHDASGSGSTNPNPAIIMSSGSAINTTAANGNITLVNTGGGVALGQLSAGSGTVSITAGSGGAVTQSAPLTAGKLELIGAGASTFTLTAPQNSVATVAVNANGAVSYVNNSALTVGNVNSTTGISSAGSSVMLQATNLTIGSPIEAGDLTLNATGTVSQTAAISGAGLDLLGGGTFNLTGPGNAFSTIATGTVAGAAYTNTGALSIGATGISSGGGSVTLKATNLTIGNPIQVGAGNLTLNATGTVSQTKAIGGGGLDLLGGGTFNLTGPGNAFSTIATGPVAGADYTNTGALSIGAAGISSSGGSVTLKATSLTIGNPIQVGAGNLTLNAAGTVNQTAAISGGGLDLLGGGTFNLTGPGNAFSTIVTGTVAGVDYTNTGALSIGAAGISSGGGSVTLKVTSLTIGNPIQVGAGNLTLNAAGTVNQTAAISGGGLDLLGGGTFNLTGPGNAFSTIVTGTVAGADYTNTGALSIGATGISSGGGSVTLQATNLTIGNPIQVGAGNLTLNATGMVSQTAAASGAGLELLGGGTFNLTGPGNAFSTIATGAVAGVNYANTGALNVGMVNTTAGIASGGGSVILQAPVLTIGSPIQVGAGNLTLNASGTVSQTAAIGGTGLHLLGGGTFGLLGPGNSFSTIAMGTVAGAGYANSGALTVGKVNATSGITSGGGSVNLQSTSLTISNPIQVGAGNLTLNVSGATTQAAAISGTGLELLGGGGFSLAGAVNTFSTVAMGSVSAVGYLNSGALTVGKVNGTTGIASGGGSVALQATALTISSPIQVGAGNLILDASGAVTQSASIAGTTLELLGSGTVALNGMGNDFAAIVANTTSGINYQNNATLTVGTIGAFGSFGGISGIASGGHDVTINAAGDLILAKNVNVGAANVLLGATGAVTETTGTVSANGLAVISGGSPVLSGTNNINLLAAQVTGANQAFTFSNANSYVVGAVLGKSGIQTNNGAVHLTTNTGDLTIDNQISAGTANVQFDALSGAVNESDAGVAANGLLVRAAHASQLAGSNNVAVLAATIGSGTNFTFTNGSGLSVGTVNGVGGISAIDGDVNLQALGALTLNSAVNAGSGTVRLVSSGDLTENGAGLITASGLSARNESTAGGDITLTAGNSFTTLAASNKFSGGKIFLVDTNPAGAVLGGVGAPAAGDLGIFLATNGLTGTGAAQAGLQSAGPISIQQPVQLPQGTLYLDANGGIAQLGLGIITANTLGARNESASAGGIVLTLANNIGFLAAQDNNGASGQITVFSGGLGLGGPGGAIPMGVVMLRAVSSGGFGFSETDGVITAGNGNIGLEGVGGLIISAPVNAGAGVVRLEASGPISESGEGAIIAAGLGVRNDGTSGDIVLGGANQIGTGVSAGILGAFNAAPGGAITISNASPIGLDVASIAQVPLSGSFGFAQTTGVKTMGGGSNGNNVMLTTAGNLDLQQNVAAPGANVLLSAGQTVLESAGVVQSKGLAVISSFAPSLSEANAVNVLAARVTGATQGFSYFSNGSFTVGSVLGINGVSTSNGPVTLEALAGDVSLANSVQAGSGDVQLFSLAGAVNESTGGVTAGSLLVLAANTSVLSGPNKVPVLAASLSGPGAGFTFANTSNLAVGTVDGFSGILTTGNGEINVQAAGSLTLNQAVNAGTGAVRLGSSGDLLQNGPGLVTAGALTVRNDSTAAGNVELTLNNQFNVLAGSNQFAGGALLVIDGALGGLTIGSDAGLSTGGFSFGPTIGLTAAGTGTIGVQTPGSLAIAAPISVPMGTVYLDAAGDLGESDAGIIAAGSAVLRNESATTGVISLTGANNIGNLAALNRFGGAGITVDDSGSGSLTVGVINLPGAIGGFNFTPTAGVVTTGGQNIGLQSGGSLAISQPIDAATGTVRLTALGGISQSGLGLITASALGVRNNSTTAGSIVLSLANQVGTIAASNTAPDGNIVIVSANPGGLEVGGVSADSGSNFALTTGLMATGNAQVGLQSAAGVTLSDPISAPDGTVMIEAQGDVQQAMAGIVTANGLGVRNDNAAGGSITLGYDNSVSTVTALNSASGGSIIITDVNPGGMAVGGILTPVSAPGFDFTATKGISTAGNGNIGLQSAGSLALTQAVNAGGGEVALVSSGAIRQTADGAITAGSLGVENTSPAAGDIVLGAANQIGVLAVQNSAVGGAVTVNSLNPAGLTVGSVLPLAFEDFSYGGFSGVASTDGGAPASNTIRLSSAGDLTVARNIAAGSGDVSLTAAGTVIETTGAITANGLGIRAANTPVLNAAANQVNVIAALITGAGQGFSYANQTALSVGIVDGITGVSTMNGSVSLAANSGDLTLLQNVSAGIGATAEVLLRASTGAVLETAGGVTAGGLAVISANAPVLTGPNNISHLAANVTGPGQAFSFTQGTQFSVDAVAGVIGITTNDGSVSLSAGAGTLGLAKNISAGSGSVILASSAGSVKESGGSVHASSLSVNALNGATLGAANGVSQFQAVNSGSGGILFNNAAPHLKILGLANAGGGNIQISTSGTLDLDGAASTGAGSILLGSLGTETVNSTVTAGTNGSVTLQATGGASDLFINQDVLAGSGNITASAGRNLVLGAGNFSASGAVQLSAAAGSISEAGAGRISGASLTTTSGSGTDLANSNRIGTLNASNGSGNIVFNNQASPLIVTGITEGAGNVVLTNSGTLHATGPLSGGGSLSIKASGTETFDGPITDSSAGSVALIATGANSAVLVNGKVQAGGALTVSAQANAVLGKSVSAGSIDVTGQSIEAKDDLAATSGDLTLQAANALYLDGANYSGNNVFLNSDPARVRAASPLASIVLTGTGLTTITAKNAFTVGYLQNLLAFGSLTINAATATIGDTAARGDLSIAADQITLMDRQEDGSSFNGRHDHGLNVVASTIDFGGADVSFSGQGNGTAFFSVASGQPNVSKIDGMTFFVDANLDGQFQQGTGEPSGGIGAGSSPALPVQPVAGGVVDAEVVAVLAGALPDQKAPQGSPEAKLSAATVAKLLSLGVNARDPDAEEKKGMKARRALFKQLLIDKANPADSDYQVVVNRIAPGQVNHVLKTYDHIFGSNQELKPKIEELFTAEYGKYIEKTNASDASGFGEYLLASQKNDPQAKNTLAVVAQFRELFSELGRIGLTPKEVEISEDVVARSLDIVGLTPPDFLTLLGTPPRQPPAPPAPVPVAPPPPPQPGPAPAAAAPGLGNTASIDLPPSTGAGARL